MRFPLSGWASAMHLHNGRWITISNNVFYYPDQGVGAAATAWDVNLEANPFDDNVYWPGPGNAWCIRNRHVKNGTWSEWQAAGQDVHSVVADPLFVDAAHGGIDPNGVPQDALAILME